MVKSTTTQIICHIFSNINPDAHVSTKNQKNTKRTKLSIQPLKNRKSLYLQADWFCSVCQHT